MHTTLGAPPQSAALFHSRAGGFPLLFCSYALLDADSNETTELDQVVVVRVTAHNGGSQDEAKPLRFRLRDLDEIRRFLIAIGRLSNEEVLS
jgi:hypothetical protein